MQGSHLDPLTVYFVQQNPGLEAMVAAMKEYKCGTPASAYEDLSWIETNPKAAA